MSTTAITEEAAAEMTIPPHMLEYQKNMQDSFWAVVELLGGLATPLNLSILAVLIGLTYWQFFRTTEPLNLPKGPKPIIFQTFTPRTLLMNNGVDGKPVYIAVRGKVYDVSAGRNFYGPGGPYENFAGRDATRGLACQSFDEEMLTKNLDGPLDPCKDLNAGQLENLKGWIERFEEKYLVVGQLKSFSKSQFH